MIGSSVAGPPQRDGKRRRGGVGVVVVTFGSDAVLGELLRSLRSHEPACPVVVVDNASPGGAPPVHDEELIVLDRNRGYGAACNVGARRLLDHHDLEAIAFLNPDVRLQGPSLRQLLAGLQQRPEVGAATGPVVDAEGRRVPSAWGPPSVLRAMWFASGCSAPRLRSALGRFLRRGVFTSGASTSRSEFEVDGHVVGGAMLVRAECFQDVGGFDPAYFMFAEDMDLCRRARDAGWEVWLLPCEPLVHLRGASSPATKEDRLAWYREGMRRYVTRQRGPRAARRLDRALRLGRLLGRLFRPRA